jgi:hypothetical protein
LRVTLRRGRHAPVAAFVLARSLGESRGFFVGLRRAGWREFDMIFGYHRFRE